MTRLLLLCALVGCKDIDEYKTKSKRIEAELQLTRIRKSLEAYALEAPQPGVPVLTLGPTPAVPCCDQKGFACQSTETDWAPWQPLGFAIEERFRFQYTYRSTDGQSFVATAIGDLDCDGKKIVYKLVGKIENGAVTATLERP